MVDSFGRCDHLRMEAASAPIPAETSPEATEGSSAPETGSEGVAEEQAPQAEGERDDQGRYLSREAAGYRRRLRETEAERDQLRAEVDRLQRAEVERLAGAAGMATPADLWALGTELAFLRGDDGALDAETVNGLVHDVLADRPHWRQNSGDLGIGKGAAASGRRQVKVGLSQLLKPGAG
jgi:hypothetical protein